MRLVGAHYVVGAAPGIVLGDLNNPRADDPGVAEGFAAWPARRRARHGGSGVDDRLFGVLEQGGYVDLFRRLHPGEPGPTVPSTNLRLDYVFATADLAERAVACEVRRAPEIERASDHLPVVADFDRVV
jgi:exodeoxyribonuclease-3